MAKALVKASGLENETPDYTLLEGFIDKEEISDICKKYIAIAIENELMKGKGEYFDPREKLTRAEMASLLNNVLEQRVDIEDIQTTKVISADYEGEEDIEPKENAYFYIRYNKKIRSGEVEVKDELGNIVPIETEIYNDEKSELVLPKTILIKMNLEPKKTYTVTTKNVIDQAGIPVGDYTYSFSTRYVDEVPKIELTLNGKTIENYFSEIDAIGTSIVIKKGDRVIVNGTHPKGISSISYLVHPMTVPIEIQGDTFEIPFDSFITGECIIKISAQAADSGPISDWYCYKFNNTIHEATKVISADYKDNIDVEPKERANYYITYNNEIQSANVEVKDELENIIDAKCQLFSEADGHSSLTKPKSIMIRMNLRRGKTYTITVKDVVDIYGDKVDDYTYTFSTKDEEATEVIRADYEGKTDVEPSKDGMFRIYYSNDLQRGGTVIVKDKSGNTVEDVTFTINQRQGNGGGSNLYPFNAITVKMDIKPNETYTITAKDVVDIYGYKVGDYTYTFSTRGLNNILRVSVGDKLINNNTETNINEGDTIKIECNTGYMYTIGTVGRIYEGKWRNNRD